MSALRMAAKDLAVEWRTRELLDAALLGALALVAIAGVSLAGVRPEAERTAAVLWTGALVASVVPLARSFTGESDRGTMELLLQLPVDRGAILLGKVLSNLVVTLAAVGAIAAADALVFGGAWPGASWGLLPVVLLGALGISVAGSTLAAIAAQARGREALLPALLFPLLLPVLLSALPATIHALRGDGPGAYLGELQLLAGYVLVFLAAGWLLFGYIVEG